MEIEYSKFGGVAYSFNSDEMKLCSKILAKGLTKEIQAIDRKIERVKNDLRNEGQVTFQMKIEALNSIKERLQKIINDFN